ncbi:MAG TPA: glutaredoxin family protein, partial [Candidatus Saccharimonadales bacterium]|nr:glutaredoxin family protein [Candidatus Saccharimonadales bacterium]
VPPSGSAASSISPELVLYSRPGCGLCDEARELLHALLAERRKGGLSVPILVERDIASNDAWSRAYFTTIPVVELGGRQVELATSVSKLRRLLATMDGDSAGQTTERPAEPAAPAREAAARGR